MSDNGVRCGDSRTRLSVERSSSSIVDCEKHLGSAERTAEGGCPHIFSDCAEGANVAHA